MAQATTGDQAESSKILDEMAVGFVYRLGGQQLDDLIGAIVNAQKLLLTDVQRIRSACGDVLKDQGAIDSRIATARDLDTLRLAIQGASGVTIETGQPIPTLVQGGAKHAGPSYGYTALLTVSQAIQILDRSERGRAVGKLLYEFLDGPAGSLDRDNKMAILTLLEESFINRPGTVLEALSVFASGGAA